MEAEGIYPTPSPNKAYQCFRQYLEAKQLEQDLKKHNTQYPPIDIKQLDLSHDRFLIVDEKEVYHFGASLKDLGKKWFAVSKMDIDTLAVIGKVDLHAKVRP
nr:hypothetical protein [Chrysiogenes arsenatis]